MSADDSPLRPCDLEIGMDVEYSPSPGHWFTGRVASEPWLLGDQTWVVHLDGMEPAYGQFTGRSPELGQRVKAAAVHALRRPLR